MKLFLIALAIIGCVMSFSRAADDEDGYATGYGNNSLLTKNQIFFGNFNFYLIKNFDLVFFVFVVQVYEELLAELKAVQANLASDSAKQAAQGVYDEVKNLLLWLRQRDSEQIVITESRVISALDAFESQLTNADQSLRNLVHEVSTKLKDLREQPKPLAQHAEDLNKIIEDFRNKLNQILGDGC